MPPDGLLLPEGTRLIHVGPPKTATTSLQAAFHEARPRLAPYGVHYAGTRRHEMLAAIAAVGGKGFLGGPEPQQDAWAELLTDIHGAADQRVVFSSEYLAQAKPPRVRSITEQIGGHQHVVLTLRPLDKLIPSQWQQYVQTGYAIAYDDWLEAMFSPSPPKGLTPTFWTRHHHDRLAARWAAEVGEENVTVVVLDSRDHAMVLRVFEAMVGLPDGTLALQDDLSNRSLTLAEIEIVREFNRIYKASDWPSDVHFRYLRNGVVRNLRTRQPDRSEPKIVTPTWAQERIAELSQEVVDNLRASGVRVVGDLDGLLAGPVVPAEPQTDDDRAVSAEVAALALAGAIAQTGVPATDAKARRAWRTVRQTPTRDLVTLARKRMRRRLARR
ncbi:UNVERIFIED_CONTAM: hypothetical protein LK11_08375 [Mumia flava]